MHEAVVAAGETESGVTVHYVTEVFDSGEIVMQQRVPVLPDDSPESLEERIHKAEYEALSARYSSCPWPNPFGRGGRSGSGIRVCRGGVRSPAVPKAWTREWAEVLKVRYEPSEASVPPPVPGAGTGASSSVSAAKYGLLDSRLPLCLTESLCRPRSFFWSMLVTLCCCFIPGIAAIVFSSMVSTRYGRGDIEGAKRASRMAEIWIIVSFCLGVLAAPLYVPLSLV